MRREALGARVLAVVGHDAKRDVLVRRCGIPAAQIVVRDAENSVPASTVAVQWR